MNRDGARHAAKRTSTGCYRGERIRIRGSEEARERAVVRP